MTPKQIRVTPDSTLVVTWQDNHVSTFGLQYLRNQCPCAACTKERAAAQNLLPLFIEGKFSVKNITQVGHYAAGIQWGDGHNEGIYSWDYLRKICPCPDHAAVTP